MLKSNNRGSALIIWASKIYIKYMPGLFAMFLISTIFKELLNIAFPAFNARVVDLFTMLTNKQISSADLLIQIGVLLCILLLTQSTLYNLSRFAAASIRARMRFLPKTLLYEKLKTLELKFLEDSSYLNKVTRYNENSWVFNQFFELLGGMIGILATFITLFIILFSQIPLVIPLIIVLSIPRIFLNKTFIKKLYKIDHDSTTQNRMAHGNASYLISASTFKEVIQIGSFNYLKKIYEDFGKQIVSKIIEVRKGWQTYSFLFTIFDITYQLVGIILIINLVESSKVTLGVALFLFSSMKQFGSTVDGLVAIYTDLTELVLKLGESKEMFEATNDLDDGRIILDTASTLPPEIEFKKLYFQYPNSSKIVLKDFNLKIKPGEKIAIVGHNGAGKTTSIKLLTKLYTATKGSILINGKDISEINSESWYKNIGVLFQDFNTYEHLTVRENIILGSLDSNYNDEKVWRALKAADADAFVKDYPNGLDTILSEKYEKGVRPSTGQWQKIAIARFFYRNAPILILDEPTSAIDAVAEANIFDRIYKFVENKTVIIISHRFSTVRNADRIIVFERGRIIEDGSHEQLLAMKGVYWNAFNVQAKGYRDSSEGEVL